MKELTINRDCGNVYCLALSGRCRNEVTLILLRYFSSMRRTLIAQLLLILAAIEKQTNGDRLACHVT